MASTLFQILIAVTAVSLISLAGIFFFLKEKVMNRILFFLVSFAAGSLLGAAFLDLLPEALGSGLKESIPFFVLIGVLFMFVLEKFLHWHHHHIGEGENETHPFTYLSLIGSALHNFTDGVIIAVSFVESTPLGIIATIAIIAHEIPHEIGDYAILIYGGFSRMKAALFNFLSALAAVLGAVIAYASSGLVEHSGPYMSAFAAGGFIYIAGTDLIPEIHKERKLKKSAYQFIAILLGIFLIYLVGKYFG